MKKTKICGIVLAMLFFMAAGCEAGQVGDACTANSDCESGCCSYPSEECTLLDREDYPYKCVGDDDNNVCCKYERRSSNTSSTGNSYVGDWQAECTCMYDSCSEIKSSTECYSGICTTHSVRNVGQVSSCD